jgi:tRNA U54 and U55 pseudouridine synthase Pus10
MSTMVLGWNRRNCLLSYRQMCQKLSVQLTQMIVDFANGILSIAGKWRCDTWSAGREDFDVRMLGGGRPFTLEFANSRPVMPPQEVFAAAQEELNAVSADQRPLSSVVFKVEEHVHGVSCRPDRSLSCCTLVHCTHG